VRGGSVGLGVPGESAVAEGFEMVDGDFVPQRLVGFGERPAGSDEPGLPEAAEESDGAGADVVPGAELGQPLMEVLAVVESDGEGPAGIGLGCAHAVGSDGQVNGGSTLPLVTGRQC